MKKILNFTIQIVQTLRVWTFRSDSLLSFNRQDYDVSGKTPEEIYAFVLDLDVQSERKMEKDFLPGRDIIFRYRVITEEIMTDDRKKFGHSNQTSRKTIGKFIPTIYTRGKEMDFKQLFKEGGREGLNIDETDAFEDFLINLSCGDRTEDEIRERIEKVERIAMVVMVPGEGRCRTFCWMLEEGETVCPFPTI